MRRIDYEAEVDKYTIRQADRARQKMEIRSSADTSDLKNPASWLFEILLGRAASSTGVNITPLKIRGVATVFACERVHMETMASLPCILYRGDGKDGQVEARDHRLFHAMYDAPNEEMTSYDFIAAMQGNLVNRHNAVAEILRDIDGDVIGLYPMDWTHLNVYRDSGSRKLKYQFMRNGTIFDRKDVLHIKNMTRNGLVGVEISTTLQEVFALALALQDNAAKFFGNGSRPGAILEHPAVMSEEAALRLKKQIEDSTGGANAYATLLLEEGTKWIKQRSENKDSQFQEAREYQDLQICRVYRIPPHKVGIKTNEPRANIEEENIAFVSDTIRPQCMNWEKNLNVSMLTLEEREQGMEFRFSLDEILRGQLKARYDAYAVGRQWGWLSVNMIKKKEKMNPVGPEGDIHLQPANMVPLGTKPNPEANSPGQGDDVKGKNTNSKKGPVVDHDSDGKIDEKKKSQSTGADQITGSGGVVEEVKVKVSIDAPPPKPKNLAGLEDTVTLQNG